VFKLILSDLHIGAGGGGSPLEDFVHDEALAALLESASAEAATQPLELILNGDTFEFWQVPALPEGTPYSPTARYRLRLYLETTERAGALRMRLIQEGHPLLFAALARFLSPPPGCGARSITFVQGNHDVQLHWGAVQHALRVALDAEGARAPACSFVSLGRLQDGLYIEHGNQHADALSRHPSPDDPRDPRRPGSLEETPGARLFIRAINRMERRYPWITSVKPQTAVFWFLLRFRPLAALQLLALFLPGLPTLLRVHRPLSRSNRRLRRDAHLPPDPARPGMAERPECPQSQLPALERIATEPALARDPVLTRGLLEEHALHAQLVRAASEIASRTGAQIVTFGHTHIPAAERLPGGALYLNTGTWTRALDLSGQPAATWRALIRGDLASRARMRLTYLWVDGSGERLIASLREQPLAPVGDAPA